LFPELPKGKRGYYSDPFQKWFSRFLTQIGAKTPKTSFHSFRHCFRDALRDADISTERVRALGGWTSKGGAEEIYGTGHRASILTKEIEKLCYPGLNLSHLYLSDGSANIC
jgi:integrase